MSFLFGFLLLYWQFKRAGLIKESGDLLVIFRLVFYMIIGAILGAFCGYRLFYSWDRFITNPLSTIDFREGVSGLSSHGATIGILAAAFLFHLRSKMSFIELLDRLTFSAALAAGLVRLGNLMNSECVGRKTMVAWAFCFPRHDGMLIPRHPSQIYEAVIALVVILVLLWVDRKFGKEKRPLGIMAGVFLSVYFSLRFLVEFFKEGQVVAPASPLTMSQILSVPFVLLGICLIIWSLDKKLPASPGRVNP